MATLNLPRQTEVRFSRREVREAAGLSDTQVRVHLDRLVELEYVLAHHGRNGQRFVYELVFDGELGSDQPQLTGLIDVEQLRQSKESTTTTDNLAAQNGDLAGSLRPANGQLAATLRMDKNTVQPSAGKESEKKTADLTETALIREKTTDRSYRTDVLSTEV